MGLNVLNVLLIVSEIGVDMSKWRSAKAFCSWLGLCPGNNVRSQPIYGNGGHDNYGRGEKVSERKVNEIGVLYVASSCAGLG